MEDEVARIRGVYAAFNRGEFEDAAAFLHPDVRWEDPPELPGADVHRGPEGVKRFWEEFTDPFETYEMHVGAIEQVGGHWLADVHVSGHGRGSGLDAEADFTQVWTLDGGLVIRSRSFLERDDAVRAALADES
jgi:ketosteroid isomerase-like protein